MTPPERASAAYRALAPRAQALYARAAAYFPGVVLAATIAAAASFVGEHHGGPVMLMALLIGAALGFLNEHEACQKGLDFSAKTLLKLGVGLLGARVSLDQIAMLGVETATVAILCLAATIALGVIVARAFRLGSAIGCLIGGSVAICGASAALAIAAALPQGRLKPSDTVFVIAAVTALSTIAMVAYPVAFVTLGFSDLETGALLGATIHDVAQVVAAGYSVSDVAGDAAVVVKLLRVTMLPVALVVISLAFSTGESRRAGLPWFVLLFLALLVGASTGLVPDALRDALSEISRLLLIVAIAALGVKASLKEMFAQDTKRLTLVVAATIFLLLLATGLAAVFW